MPSRRRLWTLVVAAAVLSGAVGAWRARDLGPGLDFVVERLERDGDVTPYRLTVQSRGGEVLGEIAIEPAGEWITISGPRAARAFRPGVKLVTTLRVTEDDGPARVTVAQKARVDRRYDLDLAERAR